jgi:hypothetical protein
MVPAVLHWLRIRNKHGPQKEAQEMKLMILAKTKGPSKPVPPHSADAATSRSEVPCGPPPDRRFRARSLDSGWEPYAGPTPRTKDSLPAGNASRPSSAVRDHYFRSWPC